MQDKLNTDEFSKLTGAVPGIEDLISKAPEAGGLAGAIGGVSSLLGGGAAKLGNLANLAGGFKNLKLDADMITKFIPVVMSFVQSKGGEPLKGLLEKVLK